MEETEFVKENPQLYDKKHKEWINVTAENSRWDRVGELLEPPASGSQCKKYYENQGGENSEKGEEEWGWPATEDCPRRPDYGNLEFPDATHRLWRDSSQRAVCCPRVSCSPGAVQVTNNKHNHHNSRHRGDP